MRTSDFWKTDRPFAPLVVEIKDVGGVAHAHVQGFVHRDFKPASIMLPQQADMLKVTDPETGNGKKS